MPYQSALISFMLLLLYLITIIIHCTCSFITLAVAARAVVGLNNFRRVIITLLIVN